MTRPTDGPAEPDRRNVLGAGVLVCVLAAGVLAAFLTAPGRPGRGRAVAFAAVVSLAGALGGWLVARGNAAEPATAVARGLAAVGLRAGLPLAALAWLQTAPDLRIAGADALLVSFYLALWATDIVLQILLGPPRHRGSSS